METGSAYQSILPHVAPTDDGIRWFSDSGCVVYRADVREVFVHGTLINSFGADDAEARNLTLVGLAKDSKIGRGKLAEAFGIGAEMLRLLRKRYEARGIEGLRPSRTGRPPKVSAELREQLYELFEVDGMNAHQAWIELGEEAGLSYRNVGYVRQAWKEARSASSAPVVEDQLEFDGLDATADEDAAEEGDERQGQASPAPSAVDDQREVTEGQAPRSGHNIRHLGSWLLVAMVHALGLHDALFSRWNRGRRWQQRLRVVVDAVIAALGIGQRCVEGVRRLETSGGGHLLRAGQVPSASWSRRVLKQYVEEASAPWVQLSMMQTYLERSSDDRQTAAVFYVDNHMRPYTGKHTVRKGWRMQDKRVLPGATDYYVHDEDGRPVYRLDVPSNDSLTAWLSPVTMLLRASLGEQQRILVAFDRAGAFPEQMVCLRQSGVEFVTYERRPYPLLSSSAFEEEVRVHREGAKEPEVIGVHESRQKNLGKGRGRVRRIALRMPDRRQVNLLAVSEEPKERLIEVMLGRWIQENAFKHGNERWGINQLDRRKVKPYPPETIIPNPARRRLDHALRLARHREGDARNKLARTPVDHPGRAKVKRDLDEALAEQRELEAQRPSVPRHAPLCETELKDKLVYHPGDYKTLLDTIRIACANAESELAAAIGPRLRRPREAKKVLANLFAAPGQVRVNGKSITVALEPTGNHNEQEAVAKLFQEVNRWGLTLPGDSKRRPLRFRSQLL